MLNRVVNKRGFTLIELMIVIAVFSILAMIVIPVVSHTVNVSILNVALSNARTIENQLKLAKADVQTGNEETFGISARDGTLTVGEVIEKQTISDACATSTYYGRELLSVWNQDTNSVELMYTDDNTNVETGVVITNFQNITDTSTFCIVNLS